MSTEPMLQQGSNGSDSVRRKIILQFPGLLLDKPVIWSLSNRHNLVFNILRASIDDGHGHLILELEGTLTDYEEGIRYLEGLGIIIEPLVERIRYDKTRCTECGACLAMCPTGSFTRDEETMGILFERAQCIACGLCARACPARAISLELDELDAWTHSQNTIPEPRPDTA